MGRDGGEKGCKWLLPLLGGFVCAPCGHEPATVTSRGEPVTDVAGPTALPGDDRPGDLRWDDLQVQFTYEKGHLTSSARLESPKIRMFVRPAQEPPSTKEKDEVELGEVPEQLTKTFPAKLDQLVVQNGELLLVDATHRLNPALWIHDLEVSLEQAATRPNLMKGPTLLALQGRVQESGHLTAFVALSPFGQSLNFSARAMIEGLRAEELYEFLRARFGVHAPSGVLRVFIGVDATAGKLRGVIKGLVEGLEIEPARRGVGSWMKAELAEIPFEYFDLASASPDATAFVVPIEGDLQATKPRIWSTVVGTLHNALVSALGFGLGDRFLPRGPQRLEDTFRVTTSATEAP